MVWFYHCLFYQPILFHYGFISFLLLAASARFLRLFCSNFPGQGKFLCYVLDGAKHWVASPLVQAELRHLDTVFWCHVLFSGTWGVASSFLTTVVFFPVKRPSRQKRAFCLVDCWRRCLRSSRNRLKVVHMAFPRERKRWKDMGKARKAVDRPLKGAGSKRWYWGATCMCFSVWFSVSQYTIEVL